jgi:hypothetical protein
MTYFIHKNLASLQIWLVITHYSGRSRYEKTKEMNTCSDTEKEAAPPISEKLLTDAEVGQILQRKRSTLRRDRFLRKGVPFVKVGRQVRYRLSDVELFLSSL